MGIQGTMRLVREPMAMSDAMAIWEMQVTKVKQDTSPAQRVVQGPASVPRSDKAAGLRAGRVRRTQGRGLDFWGRGKGLFRKGPSPLSQTLSPNPIHK